VLKRNTVLKPIGKKAKIRPQNLSLLIGLAIQRPQIWILCKENFLLCFWFLPKCYNQTCSINNVFDHVNKKCN